MNDGKLPDQPPVNLWTRLRAATPARVGLERCGDAISTDALLDFQLAHANARDAIWRSVDFAGLARQIEGHVVRVRSAAIDRSSYIRRPDLGRRLNAPSRALLHDHRRADSWDACFIIADGLSSAAIEDHSAALLRETLPLLSGWRLAPVILAEQGRVALSDEIGELLNSRLSVILIGERPGLSVGNSLGIYLTWDPSPLRRDADRNCISNIHPAGLSYAQAAAKLVWLMTEARSRRLSGVALKEEAVEKLPPSRTPENIGDEKHHG